LCRIARSSATWRRYLYIVPLEAEVDEQQGKINITTTADDTLKYSNSNHTNHAFVKQPKVKMDIDLGTVSLALKQ
jgi:hypothetical protein